MIGVIFIVLVLATFAVVGISYVRQVPTTESFLVSNRNIPFSLGAVTLTATWTQAIALVVGATFAYQGKWNFFWFLLPNIGVLLFMGVLAPRIQKALPHGYTLPQVLGNVFGPGVRTLFFLSALASLVYIISVTMTALQQWMSLQLGIASWQMSIILGIFAFLWVVRRGLPSAVIGDTLKVILIWIGIVGIVVLQFRHSGVAGIMHAVSFQNTSPWATLWSVGIPLTVTFLGSILCSPDIAERAYAVEGRTVKRSYFTAAALFAVIVVAYGSLGFLARGLGLVVSNTQPPALAVLEATAPQWTILIVTVAFVVLLTAGLASMLASAGDLLVVELYRRFIDPQANDARTIQWSRLFIAGAVIAGTLIAALNLDLSLLIQSMAAIRGEVVVPMVLALFWPGIVPGRYMFWGMLLGVVGGVFLIFGTSLWPTLLGPQAQFLVDNGKPLGALFAFLAPLGASAIELAATRTQRRWEMFRAKA